MKIQPQKVRLLGGEWRTVETVCISDCRVTMDGQVTFVWQSKTIQWQLSAEALGRLKTGSEPFDMYCALNEGAGAPRPVAVVVGDDLVEPE